LTKTLIAVLTVQVNQRIEDEFDDDITLENEPFTWKDMLNMSWDEVAAQAYHYDKIEAGNFFIAAGELWDLLYDGQMQHHLDS